MSHKTTRRSFLGTAATTLAWAGVHTYAAGARADESPNDTVNIGVVGCGARTRQVLEGFKTLPKNRVVAVCDVNWKQANHVKDHYGGGKVPMHEDFRKLLEQKDVDVILCGTQAHWHVLITIAACQAGKDIYVEKPLSNFIGEGKFAVEAAKKYNRIATIGTQQRSWEQYKKAVEIIQSGELGVISEVKVWDYNNWCPGKGSPADCDPPAELNWDFYVGPSAYRNYNPNIYYDYGYDWFKLSGAGHQVAWGVHHFDIVNWAMGVTDPVSAVGMGGKFAMPDDNREWPDTFDGIVEYGPGPVAKDGFLMQYTMRIGARRDFRAHGKCFMGSKGSLLLDRAGYTITSEEKDLGGGKREKLIEEREFRSEEDNHQEVFLTCVRDRKQPPAGLTEGYYSVLPGHLMNVSYLTGRKITWDAQKQEATGDDEANALVNQEYRKPWKLEV